MAALPAQRRISRSYGAGRPSELFCEMRFFVIRMSNGEYLTKVRIVSDYLEYEFTTDREEATPLSDSDSQIVLKRLRTLRETRAKREEME